MQELSHASAVMTRDFKHEYLFLCFQWQKELLIYYILLQIFFSKMVHLIQCIKASNIN